MSTNEERSFTEYTVTTSTASFAVGFEDYEDITKDNIVVTVDGVLAEEAGYAVLRVNTQTISLDPPVESGVVRIQRETNIDKPFNQFTAGALFSAKSVDQNFEQIRHSQQEVRDGFIFLESNTNSVVAAANAATARANAAAELAENTDIGQLQLELSNQQLALNAQKLDTGITATAKFDGVARPLSDKLTDFVTLSDVGKPVSGNWSPVLTTALTKRVNGWAYVRIPRGTYRFDSSVKIPAKTVIIMDAGVLLQHNSPDEMLFINGDKGVTNYATGYGGDGQIYIQGYGAVVDCNGLSLNQYRGMLRIAHADTVVLEGFEVRNGRHAHNIEINSSQNVLCTKLKLNDHRYDRGDKYESIQIDHATLEGLPEFGAYDNTPCRNITVEHCSFNNAATGVGTHSSTPVGKEHLNIRVVNNTFKNMNAIGVRGQSWLSSEVTGNIFSTLSNECRPIVMFGCTGSKVHRNILDDANITKQAITLTDGVNGRCQNMEVSFNRSKASTPVYIQAADNSQVFKNTLTGNIYIGGGDGTCIYGNLGSGSITVRAGTSKARINNQVGVYTITDNGKLTEIDGKTNLSGVMSVTTGTINLLDSINNYDCILVQTGIAASGGLTQSVCVGWAGGVFRTNEDFVTAASDAGKVIMAIPTTTQLNVTSTTGIVRSIIGLNRK